MYCYIWHTCNIGVVGQSYYATHSDINMAIDMGLLRGYNYLRNNRTRIYNIEQSVFCLKRLSIIHDIEYKYCSNACLDKSVFNVKFYRVFFQSPWSKIEFNNYRPSLRFDLILHTIEADRLPTEKHYGCKS